MKLISALILLLPTFIFGQEIFLTNSQIDSDPTHLGSTVIKILYQLNNGETEQGYCSGTVVSSRVIITAAHCFKSTPDEHVTQVDFEIKGRKVIERNGNVILLFPIIYNGKGAKTIFPRKIQDVMDNPNAKNIPVTHDMALIITHEPIPLEMLKVTPIPFVTKDEYQTIRKNFSSFSFVSETINPFAHLGDRKYTYFNGINFGKLSPLSQDEFISAPDRTTELEPGDSGAPLYVNIGHDWKIVAIGKGIMRRFLKISSVFAPVHNDLCEMLQQSGLSSTDQPKNACP